LLDATSSGELKIVKIWVFLIILDYILVSFSALMLLVGQLEWHPVCENLLQQCPKFLHFSIPELTLEKVGQLVCIHVFNL